MSIRFANARESVAHCSPEPQPASKARGWSKSRCGFLRGTQQRGRSTSIWVGSPMAAAGLTGPLMFVTDGPCVKARWPATRLVVRESSVELMIERSLPSSRRAHAPPGTACLDRQSWAVTDGRGAPARNRQLILAARQTLQRRTITPRGIRRQIQQQPAFGSEANTLPLASAAANPILDRRSRDAREGNAHARSRRSDSEVLAKHVKSVSAAPCSG